MAIYWVDPDATDDTGDGSKSNPWKTTNHAISAGDVIQIKKSPLTTMSWTVSGTYGQRDFIASDDPSGDITVNDVILVDGEYYIVIGISGYTIQTFKPFLGTTSSGLTCYKVGVFDIDTIVWEVFSSGNSSGYTYYRGGFDWTTEVQDGYTFIKGASSQVFKIDTKEYFKVGRICPVYTSNSYGYPFYAYGLSNCEIYGVISGSGDYYGLNISSSYADRNIYIHDLEAQGRCVIINGGNSTVLENIDIWLYGSSFADLRSSDHDRMVCTNIRINGSEHFSYSLVVGGLACFFSNLKLGEVLPNTVNSVFLYTSPTFLRCINSNIDLENVYIESAKDSKIISLNHDGASGDDRTGMYGWFNASYKNGIIQKDSSLYNTTSPSLKFTPLHDTYPLIQRFQVPVESGIKRISMYLRKDSLYNGSYRPKMIVRYFEGSTTATWKEVETEMSDVDDSWEQVYIDVVVDLDQVVEVEIRGLGTTGNFWCDDIAVSDIS